MPSLLSAADITRLKAVVASASQDTCTIRRRTIATSGAGQTPTWSDLATLVVCRVAPDTQNRGRDGQTGGRVSTETTWEITLPADQDVKSKDRIVALSKTFEVTGVLARRSFEVRTRVQAIEVA